MLKPGGRLVYSTCTFSQEENEGTVRHFLEQYPDFFVCEMKRLFPHRLRGEGHFLAVLQKAGSIPAHDNGFCANGIEKGMKRQDAKEYFAFREQFLRTELPGKLVRFGEQLYLAPEELPSLKGMKVLRPGLHLGTLKKNRFEPAHALALALSPQEACHTWDLTSDGPEVYAYLNGQTLPAEGAKGWYLITVDGYSLGWGKLSGGVMKNHYPKGLRIPNPTGLS
jgi:NOL1/NOP2/fmu family ribosome biogenesis protein